MSVKLLRTLAPTLGAFAGGLILGSLRAEATPASQSPYAALAQLGRVLVQIENHYVDAVPREKLLEGAIKGMVENLDPHSSYLTPEEWRELQSDTEGKFGGVGIEVDARGERLVVIAPIELSPAARAGVRSGDQILAVDGDDIVGQPLDKVLRRMRGAAGTKVKLTVLRETAGDDTKARVGQRLTFELTREVIHVAAVTHKLLDGNVAYLKIKQFQEGTRAELLSAVAKLRASTTGGALSGVLLDVRSNPGGLVDEATEIADEFLPAGGIYSMRHRGRIIEDLRAGSGGALAEVPVVAVVDEWSASASELLVGALQDNGRATVVGSTTFGKGSVQSVLPLPSGAGLKLTTARYYTPSGHAIQADGIHPDVLIERDERSSSDSSKILRERDLPGHLAAEGARGPGRATTTVRVEADPAGNSVAALRDVPRDPSSSPDAVLRIAYQVLRGQLAKR